MKRRQFFKMFGKTGLGLMAASVAPLLNRANVDVATEEETEQTVSLVDDPGGYLVPQEYQDQILLATTRQYTAFTKYIRIGKTKCADIDIK